MVTRRFMGESTLGTIAFYDFLKNSFFVFKCKTDKIPSVMSFGDFWLIDKIPDLSLVYL